jgi:hypothetical protein
MTIAQELNKWLDKIEKDVPNWPELRKRIFRFIVEQKHKSWQDAYLTARWNVIEEGQTSIKELKALQKKKNCPTHKKK